MLARSEDHVTSSWLNNLYLGHLVSRDWDESFRNGTVWGQAEIGPSGTKINGAIQIMKLKVQLRNGLTKVQIFATDKEKPKLHPHEDYETVAPRGDFNLGIEPRHVFN
jgi:hypothetical protein